MVTHLFKDFLLYKDDYRRSEQLWVDLFDRVVSEHDQVDQWRSWMPTTRLDGTQLFNGNPIFNSESSRLRRAVRIIQDSPTTIQRVEIDAWLDRFDHAAQGGPGPRDELVISCALSEEAAKVAYELLSKWVDPGTSMEGMRRFIDEACPLGE